MDVFARSGSLHLPCDSSGKDDIPEFLAKNANVIDAVEEGNNSLKMKMVWNAGKRAIELCGFDGDPEDINGMRKSIGYQCRGGDRCESAFERDGRGILEGGSGADDQGYVFAVVGKNCADGTADLLNRFAASASCSSVA